MTPRGAQRFIGPPDNTSIVLRYMLYSTAIARPASTIEFSSPTFTFSGRSHLRYGNYPQQQQQVELRGEILFCPRQRLLKNTTTVIYTLCMMMRMQLLMVICVWQKSLQNSLEFISNIRKILSCFSSKISFYVHVMYYYLGQQGHQLESLPKSAESL